MKKTRYNNDEMKRLMCFDSVLSIVLLIFIIVEGLRITLWQNALEGDNWCGTQNFMTSNTPTPCEHALCVL